MWWERLQRLERMAVDYMGKFADLVVLSVLWLVCSLALITLIPSSSALYYAAVKSLRRDCGRPVPAFFHSFRQNLSQGIQLSLLTGTIFVAGIAGAATASAMDTASSVRVFFAVAIRLLLILFAMMVLYLAPALSRFTKPLRRMLCFSFLLIFRHWPSTLALLCLAGLCGAGIWFSPMLVILLPGIYALISSFVVERIFRQYMEPPPEGLSPDQLPWYWK